MDVIRTDQNGCYDTDGKPVDCAGSGQDGEIRSGLEWPAPRFDQRDGLIIDRLSALMWTRDAGPTGFPQTWCEALDFIGKINHEQAFGYQDWRLPERQELFSLVSHDCINPALPAGAPFENIFAGYYWTATTCSRLEDQAWYIHLGGGRIYRGMKYGSYMVWPVRCQLYHQTAEPPGGGRSDSSSKNWTNPTDSRYAINRGKIYDRFTGLEWAKMNKLPFGPMSWAAAFDFIRAMNAANIHGYSDWRLPNVRELESLIDVRQHTPALSDGHPFDQVPEGCWSSTTSRYEPRYAWVVYMQDGAVGVGFKKNTEFYVWAVRGGIV